MTEVIIYMTIAALFALWAEYRIERNLAKTCHQHNCRRLYLRFDDEKRDNDHFRKIVPSQIVMLNERAEEIRTLKRQLANRKGQIAKLKKKLEAAK